MQGEPCGDRVYERHGALHVWSTSGGIPREVAMGVGMAVTGMRRTGVLIPIILLVMHVDGVVIIVEVGWSGMGEEHLMRGCTIKCVTGYLQGRPLPGG